MSETVKQSPKPSKIKKSKPDSIDLEPTKFWRDEILRRELYLRDNTANLETAKLRLDTANKEYREALRSYNHDMHEVLSLCVDVVLNRLPLAERRFLIKEISGIARFWSGKGDIVISRDALMRFIESLVFHCM